MKTIAAIIIFCIVLFFYLHLLYHLKTSDDLEVYTIDNPSKDKLEEICDLRQPVTFEFHIDNIHMDRRSILKKYGAFDIRVRDVYDLNNDYVPLALNFSDKLFENDKESKYFTENNQDFLEESGLIKIIQHSDAFLRPPLVSNCNYDILYGSEGTCTPYRYELNYRTYFYVNKGTVKLKLSPPKSSKYLYSENDYENFEFRSLINPWNVQSQYQQDFNRTKCLDMVLHENAIIFIPAYWWYSIQFNSSTELVAMKYRTYMNNIAIAPHLFMGVLQNQNVKIRSVKNLAKTVDVLNNPNKMDDNESEIINNENTNTKIIPETSVVGTTDISKLLPNSLEEEVINNSNNNKIEEKKKKSKSKTNTE